MTSPEKVIITKYNDKLITILGTPGNASRLFVSRNSLFEIGDILIGRVQKVKNDLKAAFVELNRDVVGFLPFEEIRPEFLINRPYDGRLKENDHVIVMVSREPVRTKPFTLTMNLTLTGKYCVVHTDSVDINISSKIPGDRKAEFKKEFEDLFPERKYGFILRTNILNADTESIAGEIRKNYDLLNDIAEYGHCKSLYTVLFKSEPDYIRQVRDLNKNSFSEIITDDPDVYGALNRFFNDPSVRITYHGSDEITLKALYSIEKIYRNATDRCVLLKSGGSIVIERTEALTAIDVNSGKTDKKDKSGSTFEVNREALKEIAHQLIIRNISGMILVDFINFDSKEAEEEFIGLIKQTLKKDPVPAQFIDITPLGLAEITRQKKYSSLYDLIS